MIRWATGIAGAGLALFGVFRLLTEIPALDLLALLAYLVAALFLHDGVLAPISAAAGAAITRLVPRRLRRYVQAGLVACACVVTIALPLILLEGSQPAQKAILRQHYVTNLAILVGLIVCGTAALYLLRVLRDQRTRAAKVRPLENQISSDR